MQFAQFVDVIAHNKLPARRNINYAVLTPSIPYHPTVWLIVHPLIL